MKHVSISKKKVFLLIVHYSDHNGFQMVSRWNKKTKLLRCFIVCRQCSLQWQQCKVKMCRYVHWHQTEVACCKPGVISSLFVLIFKNDIDWCEIKHLEFSCYKGATSNHLMNVQAVFKRELYETFNLGSRNTCTTYNYIYKL